MLWVIMHALRDEISWPSGAEQLQMWQHLSPELRACFPAGSVVFGAVDGTVKPISVNYLPPFLANFWSGKYRMFGYNHQIFVDIFGRIIFFVASAPGGRHDAAVYRMSEVFTHPLPFFPLPNHFLVADDGYVGVSPCLLVPLPETAANFMFNEAHRYLRSIVENVIGALGSHFHILVEPCPVHFRFQPFITSSCFYLFNFMRRLNPNGHIGDIRFNYVRDDRFVLFDGDA